MTDEAKALVANLRDEDSYYRIQEKHWCIDGEELERQRLAAADLIETQASEIERLREALEREPKAWLIADEDTAWVTLFKPNPKDHPWGDVIPLYSAALAGDSHD